MVDAAIFMPWAIDMRSARDKSDAYLCLAALSPCLILDDSASPLFVQYPVTAFSAADHICAFQGVLRTCKHKSTLVKRFFPAFLSIQESNRL